MPLWSVSMLYSTNVLVEVDAITYEEALNKARSEVDEFKSDYFETDDVEFDEILHASKLGGR